MKTIEVYQALAASLLAIRHCSDEWIEKHEARIEELSSEFLPSGFGFDNGTRFDLEASTANRLLFHTSFHHMDEHGSYDGWSDHDVIITPSLLSGIDVRVTGRDRNDIKEYIGEQFMTLPGTD